MIKLANYLGGYLTCELRGVSSERFMNLCRHRGIYLWDISPYEDMFVFKITVKDFKQLKQIVKKSKMKVSIKKRFGFPFLILKNRKHKMFFCGIILCIVILYILSLFVWDIEITGNSYYTDTTIVKFLEELNITIGTPKKSISPAELEEELRLKYNNISWVSAQVIGTKLFVNLEEISPGEAVTEEDEPAYYDLIAANDGIVTSMITRTGTPIVNIGDTVAKGDVLVSGMVKIYNDDATERLTKLVKADADIFARTTYEYKEKYPLTYIKRNYTGNTVKSYSILLLSHRIELPFLKNSYDNYDTTSITNKYRLTTNFYLPFSSEVTISQEYMEEEYQYTKEEILKIANEALAQFISDLESSGATLIRNDVEIQVTDNTCTASGTLVFDESIGSISLKE